MAPLLLSLLPASWAATWVVDQAGGGDATTIAEGVALLGDGDTLHIRAGVYAEEKVMIQALNTTIEGDGADVTILDGMGIEKQGLASYGGVTVRGLAFENFTSSGLAIGVYDWEWLVDSVSVVEDCAFATDDWVLESIDLALTGDGITTNPGDATLIIRNSLFQQAAVSWWQRHWTTLRIENSIFIDTSVTIRLSTFDGEWVGHADRCLDEDYHNNLFIRSSWGSSSINPTTCTTGSDFDATNNIVVGSGASSFSAAPGTVGIASNNLIGTDAPEPTATTSNVEFADNLTADPQFYNWSDDADWTNDDLRLLPGSPGIDLGIQGYAEVTADIRGYDRVIDGDLDGFAAPDAGPYEMDPDLDVVPTGDSGDSADTGGPTDSGVRTDSGDGGTADTAAPTDSGGGDDTGLPGIGGGDVARCGACNKAGAAWLLLFVPCWTWRRRV